MPHPDGLPDLFIDRSLGRIQVPELLRAAGLRLVTLAERYGVPADEKVTDVQWLADAAQAGEVVFMKDERIRYKAAEKMALIQHGVRAFCLSRGDLDGPTQAGLFLEHLPRIVAACRDPGPFLYAVNRQGLRSIDLT